MRYRDALRHSYFLIYSEPGSIMQWTNGRFELKRGVNSSKGVQIVAAKGQLLCLIDRFLSLNYKLNYSKWALIKKGLMETCVFSETVELINKKVFNSVSVSHCPLGSADMWQLNLGVMTRLSKSGGDAAINNASILVSSHDSHQWACSLKFSTKTLGILLWKFILLDKSISHRTWSSLLRHNILTSQWNKVFGLCFPLLVLWTRPHHKPITCWRHNERFKSAHKLPVSRHSTEPKSRVFGIFLRNVPTNCLALSISLFSSHFPNHKQQSKSKVLSEF